MMWNLTPVSLSRLSKVREANLLEPERSGVPPQCRGELFRQHIKKMWGASSHFQKNHDFVKISWIFMIFLWKSKLSSVVHCHILQGFHWFSMENHEISWDFHKIVIFLKMRGGTPPKILIFCLNNSPDHPERTADAFPVSQPDIRDSLYSPLWNFAKFHGLNRGIRPSRSNLAASECGVPTF